MDALIPRCTMDFSTRRILALAGPAMLSMLSFNLMQFTDRIFLARFNPTHFAAVLPSSMMSFTLLSFFIGAVGFVSALSSQYTGAGKKHEAARSAWQGIYFSLFAGAFILLTAWPFSKIFVLLGHEPHIARLEEIFYIWMSGAAVFSLISTALGSYFGGISNTRVPMIAGIIANVINAVLDYFFIFGAGPIPAMGIQGAAIATFIASVVNVGILFAIFLSGRQRRDFDTVHHIGLDRNIMGRLLRFGTPAGFQFFIEVGGWGLLFLFLARLGEASLMAVNISISIESFAFMGAVGLATASGILVGQARGANNFPAIHLVMKRSIRILLFYEAVIMVVFLGFPEALVSIFSSGENSASFEKAKELAVPILRLTGVWLAVDAVRILLSGVLKTLGDTFFLMVVNVAGAVFLIAGAVAIGLKVPNPLVWIWCFIIAWVVILWAILYVRFRSGEWKKFEVIENSPH